MTKRLAQAAIVALKEALCSVYWYKAELRSFLQQCISDKTLVASLNWDNYKRQIASDLVDHLCKDQDRYLGDLTRLCHELTTIKTFTHLEQLDGGAEKAARARAATRQLKDLLTPYEELKREADAVVERQKQFSEKLKANTAVREKLREINHRFFQLSWSPLGCSRRPTSSHGPWNHAADHFS